MFFLTELNDSAAEKISGGKGKGPVRPVGEIPQGWENDGFICLEGELAAGYGFHELADGTEVKITADNIGEYEGAQLKSRW